MHTTLQQGNSIFYHLVRHGTCDRDPVTQKYANDWTTSLNPEGIEACRSMARSFWSQLDDESKRNPQSFGFVSSPFRRVVQTAEIFRDVLAPSCIIDCDPRLCNKQDNNTIFEQELKSFFAEKNALPSRPPHLFVFTHGRIIKMIQSLVTRGFLCLSYMNTLPDIQQDRIYTFPLFAWDQTASEHGINSQKMVHLPSPSMPRSKSP